MTEKEMLEQLEDLIVDRKSLISSDSEMNEMFIKDIVALELIISKYKELKLNDTVKILEEEKKIPEKLETYKENDDEDYFANILKVSENGEYEIDEATSVIVDKLNEIIDYLKSKGDE